MSPVLKTRHRSLAQICKLGARTRLMSKFLGKLSPIFSRASEWSKTTRKAKFDSFKDVDWKKKISDTASEGALLATEIMVIVGAFQIVTHYFVNFTFCVGPSMLPTINQSGDVVLIDLISYKIMNEEYKTGDVVISLNPYDSKKTVCKRIAATAGEVIFISFKDKAPGSSSGGVAITRPELSSSSSNSNSSTDVSIRSLELDSRSNSNFWENSYLKSDCSAKEQTGDHTHSIGSPAVESSGGGDKGTDPDTYTGALKIDNTNPIVETVINGEILEENDGGLSAVDSTVSSIEDSQIAVTTKVRRPKKKPRKPVQAYSEPYIIPPGHVWLAGDNTANSTDSRYYGPVPVALLRGRVFLKFVLRYPPFEAVVSSPEILYQKGPQPKDIVADYVELNLKAVEEILQNNEDKDHLLINSDHEGEKKI